MAVKESTYGYTKDNREVKLFTFSNTNGLTVRVLNYGCAIESILIPKDGKTYNVVLGYDSLKGYENGSSCIGAFVGRYGARIGNASFSLHGKTYKLSENDGKNHLHGCFPNKVFSYEILNNCLILSYESPDMEDGFPGNVKITVKYSLSEDNSFNMEYTAVSDKDTVVNLFNHSYFNLNGEEKDILSHLVSIDSSEYLEITDDKIPTGRILSTENTPYDFRDQRPVGKSSFDNSFVLSGNHMDKPCAYAVGDKTGIKLEVFTTQPSVHFYTGDYTDCDSGKKFVKRAGLCFETQHYPDSPNKPMFPSTVLKAGDTFKETTKFRFSW